MLRSVALVLLFALLSFPAGAAEPEAPQAPEPSPESAGETADETLWKQIQALYESARKAGDINAGSLAEWLKSDYQNIGDWEYRVIRISSKESSVLETYLNTEGQERWEVFWVREGAGDFTFFLKRPVRSYIRAIPLSDLLKLIPGSGSE